jgi:hypothetical protein
MPRPPSYSDSFIVLHSDTRLEPLFLPDVKEETHYVRESVLFIFKGSLHVLFISVFETTFYFLYVNRSENAGILNTIDTYYQPLVRDCRSNWTNTTRWLLNEFIQHEINLSAIDTAGSKAALARQTYNNGLLVWSSLYSMIAMCICLFVVAIVHIRAWKVAWRHIFIENLIFIVVLASYEFFFFETIIYKYLTISTPELNQYIVDGLASCTG